MTDSDDLIAQIREGTIGDDHATWGPFGPRRITYADTAASGRAVALIENFIRAEVLPHYANTHSEASGTARQTSTFREDARAIVAREVGAGPDASVIFCGSGTTAAIAKVIGLLGLRVPDSAAASLPASQRPVVFIGPYEHHSNDLAWRETIADVVVIPEDRKGGIDLTVLKNRLEEYKHRPLRIGSFSAASNVTGILTDVEAVTALLKRHGALSMFDFAGSGSHVHITLGDADALFISPHKFVGGVGTSGILVARNSLFQNRVPVVAGGGTVLFVSDQHRDYTHHNAEKEEGGTPGIVENIRTGLVFQLKAAVGYDVILKREEDFLERALAAWRRNPCIEILGHSAAKRTSIVSFLVASPHSNRGQKQYLHHNFVVALLNDLFGIQARGGCSCAGPYGHRLLKVDQARSERFRHAVVRGGLNGIKPGWTRVSFSYTFSARVFEYILAAVDMVATHGWRLLPQYAFDPTSGLWTHRTPGRAPLSLDSIRYDAGRMVYESRAHVLPESELDRHVADAIAIFGAARPSPSDSPAPTPAATSALFEELRWFDLPPECLLAKAAAGAWPAGGLPTPPSSPHPLEADAGELGQSGGTPNTTTAGQQGGRRPSRPFFLTRKKSFSSRARNKETGANAPATNKLPGWGSEPPPHNMMANIRKFCHTETVAE